MKAPQKSATSDGPVRLRRVLNLVNLSTASGLLLARLSGCRVDRGPRQLHLASGYRRPFPYATAFTVGNVLITRGDWDSLLHKDPGLLPHEEAHTWQWMALGPLFLPAYLVAMGWSWLRTGDRSSANWFEIRAGLDLGGYRQRGLRPIWRRGES